MTGRSSTAGAPSVEVLFVVAAGPRRGFGHLRRAISLARALDVRPVVAVRGDVRARRIARCLGGVPVTLAPRQAVATLQPRVIVIDDPNVSATRAWRAAAKATRTPVVAVFDLGLGRAPADLVVDGSITLAGLKPCAAARAASARSRALRVHDSRRAAQGFSPARHHGGGASAALLGPRYAILDPRLQRHARQPDAQPTVLIALGGGPHAAAAARLAREIRRHRADVRVRVAAGFAGIAPVMADGITWLPPLPGLGPELCRCTVAVLGGGVSLYEGCALGVPTVAASVVTAQRPTIEGFVRRGAIIDGGHVTASMPRGDLARLARRVIALIGDSSRRTHLARRARHLVDLGGAVRVSQAIRALAGQAPRTSHEN